MEKLGLEEILAMAKSCDKNVTVGDVAELYEETLSIMYNSNNPIMKNAEKVLGEHDFFSLLASIHGTFIATLFANVNYKSDAEKFAFGKATGADEVIVKRKR